MVGVLSIVLNVLTLSGSLYLMMVYDRVLPAQSLPTLIGLFAMIVVAYAFQGAFEMLRSQLLGDVATGLDRALSARAKVAELQLAITHPDLRERLSPTRDLDLLRNFIAGAGPAALIDLPWIAFFLLVLTLVHVWLGVVTLAGALVLAAFTWAMERETRRTVESTAEAANARHRIADRNWRHVEVVFSMGMRERMIARWETAHRRLLDTQATLNDKALLLAGLSKVFRIFLQSLVLTVGAVLVIEGKATAGIIFASSILSGRALAPVDQAIANWKGFVQARRSWSQLDTLFRQLPQEQAPRTALAPPTSELLVEHLALTPPAATRLVVSDVQFRVSAGQAVGIIGPSASGKSSLLRGVIGAWKPARGTVRLDGAALDQWNADVLGRHIGYLPQSVELFAGTVAENIARFEPSAPAEAVLAAAQAAGVHDMILQFDDGYETHIGEDGTGLSAGQRQRIALARALYRDPFLVVLDEPNSNLDPEGEAALAAAITGVKARGGIVLLVAHRASILATVEHLLVMQAGKIRTFGPRDDVLARIQPKPPASGGLSVVGR